MACRSRCASHHPSLLSVLCPLRFFTSCGFARYTLTTSSNTLNTGFQYEPVLSITTWVTSCCFSQSRNLSSSARIVPNLRISTRGSPSNGPTMTHTAKNFLPTSIPAHRSILQRSSPFSFSGWRVADVSRDIFFLGSTTPFGGSSRPPDQFRSRDDYAPLKNPAALPRPTSILSQLPPHIFISGGGQA